jgi:glycosyltransferase involved in cell wall biosynthesis
MSAPDDFAGVRVLHVVETLPGGPAAYLDEVLSWQLRHLGSGRVALLAPAGQFGHLSPAARDGLVEFAYPRSGRNPLALWRLHRALGRAIAGWRPELLHVHCSFAGVVARLARPSVPLVYCAHGWAFSRETSPLLKSMYRWIERRLQARADAVLAISEHERAAAAAAGLDLTRITTVRHGLRPLGQPSPSRTPRAVHAPLRLLFIGRFDRQKGLDWLLRTLATMSTDRVQLTVVGAPVVDAPPQLSPSPGVRFTGWLTPPEVGEYLDQADALVVPSRWEGFGLVAIEAMRRGVPVLASNRGALPEVVAEAGLVFDLERPHSLLEQLDALTPETLCELGRRGLSRFEREFSAERMNRQTLELYSAARRVHAARTHTGATRIEAGR